MMDTLLIKKVRRKFFLGPFREPERVWKHEIKQETFLVTVRTIALNDLAEVSINFILHPSTVTSSCVGFHMTA